MRQKCHLRNQLIKNAAYKQPLHRCMHTHSHTHSQTKTHKRSLLSLFGSYLPHIGGVDIEAIEERARQIAE